MNYPNRGKALIINNRVFDRRLGLGERTGTDVDAVAIQQRFSEMGFEAEIVDNQTVKDMVQILHKGNSAYQKNYFLISQPKHMLWVLKRTISMRWFF